MDSGINNALGHDTTPLSIYTLTLFFRTCGNKTITSRFLLLFLFVSVSRLFLYFISFFFSHSGDMSDPVP